jgi:hypothetical protein
MAYTKLIPHFTTDANVEEISNGDRNRAYRLSIPAGLADQYRLAQLDDYTKEPRGQFPLRSPINLSLSARISSDTIPGTWGFGLWNDPFGLSLGFGGNPFRLPALPNAVWFFGASKENYLSFKDPRAPEKHRDHPGTARQGRCRERRSKTEVEAPMTNAPSTSGRLRRPSAQGGAANGFLAQTFRSPRFHPLLIAAGLALPFSRKTTRRLLGKIIAEDGLNLSGFDQPVKPTEWHKYRIEWREDRVHFEVDDVQLIESPISPNPPLGLVIWIDNQYAAFTPDGKLGFGVLENPEPAWLEVKDIEITM